MRIRDWMLHRGAHAAPRKSRNYRSVRVTEQEPSLELAWMIGGLGLQGEESREAGVSLDHTILFHYKIPEYSAHFKNWRVFLLINCKFLYVLHTSPLSYT